MLFLQTVLNYQDFMYPNISPCPSLLPLKTAATFASLKLSLLTRRGNRSKDPDRRSADRICKRTETALPELITNLGYGGSLIGPYECSDVK